MIALRRFPREEWEGVLRSYGCEPLEGVGPLNTAEWWRFPWEPHVPFTVPVDEDGYADPWGFQRLLSDMARLAPKGWEPPDL